MSTIQPSADHSKPRLRGDMYLRAEQRQREEMASAKLTAMLTAATAPLHPPRTEKHPALDQTAETVIAPPPVSALTEIVTLAPTAATSVAVPAPPAVNLNAAVTCETPSRRQPRQQQRAAPLAVLAALAIVATLGVAFSFSLGDHSQERTTTAAVAGSGASSSTESPTTPIAEPVPVATTMRPAPSAKPTPAVARPTPRAAATSTASRALDGQLRVSSTPAGARVTIDGIGWGQTPVTVGHLPFGTKTIRVTRDGYQSQQAIVHVSQERPAQTVSIPMRRR
jgi:hypothetical protein